MERERAAARLAFCGRPANLIVLDIHTLADKCGSGQQSICVTRERWPTKPNKTYTRGHTFANYQYNKLAKH